MSNKIPTAEEFLQSKGIIGDRGELRKDQLIWLIVEFAKLHRKAILEAAAVNVRTTCLADRFLDDYDSSKDAEGDIFTKDSILNAYPENLIQ